MSFYMNFGAFNEGEQADAYKAKKRDERIENFRHRNDGNKRVAIDHVTSDMSKVWKANTYADYDTDKKRAITKAEKNGLSEEEARKHEEKMRSNAVDGHKIAKKEYDRRAKEMQKLSKGRSRYDEDFDDKYPMISDAVNRHIRRHPEAYKEEGIFAETCFIDD